MLFLFDRACKPGSVHVSSRKRQPSSIFTANYFAVQAQTGSATMKGTSSSVAKRLQIKVLHRIGFTANLCCHRSG